MFVYLSERIQHALIVHLLLEVSLSFNAKLFNLLQSVILHLQAHPDYINRQEDHGGDALGEAASHEGDPHVLALGLVCVAQQVVYVLVAVHLDHPIARQEDGWHKASVEAWDAFIMVDVFNNVVNGAPALSKVKHYYYSNASLFLV